MLKINHAVVTPFRLTSRHNQFSREKKPSQGTGFMAFKKQCAAKAKGLLYTGFLQQNHTRGAFAGFEITV